MVKGNKGRVYTTILELMHESKMNVDIIVIENNFFKSEEKSFLCHPMAINPAINNDHGKKAYQML